MRDRRAGVTKTVLPLTIVTIGILALPGTTAAQAVSPDQLVGTWWTASFTAPTDHMEDIDSAGFQAPVTALVRQDYVLTLRADSTWSTHLWFDGQERLWQGQRLEWMPQDGMFGVRGTPRGRWRLSGDTLRFLGATATTPVKGACQYHVTVRGSQVVLGRFAGPDGWQCPVLLTSVDSMKALPAAEPTSTVKRADLVGAWVSPKPRWSDGPDTLTFRADSTWMHTRHTATGAPLKPWTGKWVLLPGDKVRITLQNDSLHTYQWVPDADIDLRDNRLTFYNGQKCEDARSWKVKAGQMERVWLYNRIAP